MKRAIRLALALAVVGLMSGCFTPQHVSTLRAKHARESALKLQAKDNTVYAGIDVYGLKEALQEDPGGTSAALGKDALLAAAVAAAAAYAADQANGGSKDGGQSSKPNVPNVQADTFIYNQGNGSVNYSAGNGTQSP